MGANQSDYIWEDYGPYGETKAICSKCDEISSYGWWYCPVRNRFSQKIYPILCRYCYKELGEEPSQNNLTNIKKE